MPRSGLIAVLDIGSSKIACFVARIGDEGQPQVVGVGQNAAEGIRNGAIVDLEAARNCIVNTVHAAERMADETVRNVSVGFTCGRPGSETVGVDLSVAGHEVTDSDVRRVLDRASRSEASDEREEVHRIPTGFRLDGVRGIPDPRGMFGDTLGVDVHILTADASPLRTIATCIASCHLSVERFVLAPYAAGLACLVPDELSLGATVIDMGSGTTGVAVFEQGHLIHGDVIPIGGGHVTNDIAQGLSTPLAQAERLKILHGSTLCGPSEARSTIDVPQIGAADGAPPQQVPRALLTSIIRPRLEETFELLRARLAAAGLSDATRRVVLTGGASLLHGTRETAASIFDCRVRTARPHRHDGLAEAATAPAFAACAGLLTLRAGPNQEGLRRTLGAIDALRRKEANGGVIRRISSWFQEHL